jgi:hypothetical protein
MMTMIGTHVTRSGMMMTTTMTMKRSSVTGRTTAAATITMID